jgi:hypothetical protein
VEIGKRVESIQPQNQTVGKPKSEKTSGDCEVENRQRTRDSTQLLQ